MTAPVFASTQRFIRSRQSLLFPILDVLLNLFNWGFHVIVSWFLLPLAYGQLNSLLALLSLLMVLGVALQILTARHVASQGLRVAPTLTRLSWVLAGAFCVFGAIGLPFLMWLTRASALSIGIVLLIFALNAILSVQRGVTQGQTTFLSLNGSFYLEVAVKLVATPLFLSVWRRPEAALLGVAAGMAASLWASFGSSLGAAKPAPEAVLEPLQPWLIRLSPIFAASFFLYFFSSVDMLIVNRLLPGEAGIYAVTAKYGQILFFAALSVGTVFIPQLSRARTDRAAFKKLALRLVGLLGVLDVLALFAGLTILPFTVAPVFGKAYAPASSLLIWAMLAYGLLSLCFCLVNILVVLEQRIYLILLLTASIALVISLNYYHQSLNQVLQIMALIYGILLLCLGLLIASRYKDMFHATHS